MGTCEVKARKGLIRATVDAKGGVIERALITGDFMLLPEDKVFDLERALLKVRLSRDDVERAVREALGGSTLIGCSYGDFVDAIMCAGEGG